MKPLALIPFGSDSSCIDILELHGNHVVAHHCAEVALDHGYRIRMLPMRTGDTLRCDGADLVINLCEGEPGQPWCFVEGTRAIETSGVPFTGNSSRCLANCLDKCRMKRIMKRARLPTPLAWSLAPSSEPNCSRDHLIAEGGHRTAIGRSRLQTLARTSQDLTTIQYPVIVKPVACHGSLLVSYPNVCRRRTDLERFLDGKDRSQWFAEEFIPGEEISIGIVAGRPVGWIRAHFVGRNPLRRIITRDRKWDFSSADAMHPPSEVHTLFTGAARQWAELARRAFRTVGGRSYGRVDMRLDARGQPHIIDINPNCYIGDDGILNQIYRRHGRGFQEMLAEVLELTNSRLKR